MNSYCLGNSELELHSGPHDVVVTTNDGAVFL